MISNLVQHGFIVGFFMGASNEGNLNIFHLLFADDSLFFCKAEHNQIQTLRAIFMCFEVVSSLRVNFDKLELVQVGNVRNIQSLASILEYKLYSLPLKYLSLLLGAPSRVVTISDIVIEKMKRRLVG